MTVGQTFLAVLVYLIGYGGLGIWLMFKAAEAAEDRGFSGAATFTVGLTLWILLPIVFLTWGVPFK